MKKSLYFSLSFDKYFYGELQEKQLNRLPSKHLLVLKTSSRRLQDMCWKRLQHVFNVTILRLPRRLGRQKIVALKTSWRRLDYMIEDVLKTCQEDILKTCLEDVLKTLWRQEKYLLEISVSNKSKCVSNKSIFNKSTFDNSRANPKCIK